MYDRLRADPVRTCQTGQGARRTQAAAGPITRGLYQSILGALGLRFNLVESYGGGEAERFAVMGEAFREQFLAQGVRKQGRSP